MTFTPDDYFPFVFGSGAAKLADSQVAPLVAAVRGYRSFSSGENTKPAKELADYSSFGKKVAVPFKAPEVQSLFRDGGDVMVMPIFSLAGVLDSETDSPAWPSSNQVRPENPRVKDGKTMKYVFPKDAGTFVSLHPAFTKAWVDSAQRIMITEGTLKEDALVTALLLDAGVTEAELGLPSVARGDIDSWARSTGFALLRALFDRVPVEKRITPVSASGVQSWNTAQFATLSVQGRTVTIAFDGDVKSNPNVWREAEKLWSYLSDRGAHPRILALGSAAARMEIAATEKFRNVGQTVDGKVVALGVDDYLSHVGTLETLLSYVDTELPVRPEANDDGYRIGDWRVSADGLSTEQFVSGQFGNTWQPMIPIGGVVTSITVNRTPTLEEVRQGRIHPSEDRQVTQRANLVLSWRSEFTGEQESVTLEIETAMLNSTPDRWTKEVQSSLPPKLTMHPSWPPQGKEAVSWVQAIKRNSGIDWTSKRSWGATGWVPCANGDPVYVIGHQVLGPTRDSELSTGLGVDDAVLPNVFDFGVADNWWDLVDPSGAGELSESGLAQYRAQVKADIEQVYHHFLETGVWKNHREYGIVLLASALRTTLPKRPGVPLYLSGTPGSGKSYSIAMAMAAWQSRPGMWSAQHLPGSASSTAFALEKIMSVCGGGMWVADDLAPSVSQSAAVNAEAGMESIVRSVFNDSSRQRGTKDGGLAKSGQPRAMLAITAENGLTSTSVLERVLELKFESGIIDDKASKALISEALDTLALSRVAGAMVRFWYQKHQNVGRVGVSTTWLEKIENLDGVLKNVRHRMTQHLTEHYGLAKGASDRRVQLVSEVVLVLDYMRRLYEWSGGDKNSMLALSLGVPSNYEKTRSGYSSIPGFFNVTLEMLDMASEQLKVLTEKKNGASLMHALSDALAGGKGHLANPNQPGIPPFIGQEHEAINRALGWEIVRGDWTSRGESIGFAGNLDHGKYAVFNSSNAFQLAQRHYPAQVPHGQKAEGSWRAAIAEGLAVAPSGESQTAARSYAQRVSMGKGRVRGVLVPLESIVGSISD
ncbi:hypothetical protein [Leucobacter sp. cx-169]|uniref:hypothetical protein n=1 Tax=Leucobacter sp. cx-169 TaxID=2770549 RepID=UPI00165E70EB|nr:hypothetical protein [Leucobacter sp. cx-169]MBC9927335.1 hypothetical protein [Leucobacter sp. cx-169]